MQTQKQTQTLTQHKRQIRVDREHANEVQKIELAGFDVENVEIDTRILNKIRRKMSRQK